MNAKKIFVIFLISLMPILLFLCGCDNSKEKNISPDEMARLQSEELMECVVNKDAKTFKKMFSKNITKTSNCDANITEFFDFIDGEITSYDTPRGSLNCESTKTGKVIEQGLSGETEHIKTDAGKTYRIAFYSYSINEENPESIGIVDVAVFDVDTYIEGIGYPEHGKYEIK